jgi:hypothetical protein
MGRHLAIKNSIGTHMAMKTRCCMLRRAKNTTDISASTGRNDFIFDMWLWHGDLYRVSPFQVYRTSTSCLQCDLKT